MRCWQDCVSWRRAGLSPLYVVRMQALRQKEASRYERMCQIGRSWLAANDAPRSVGSLMPLAMLWSG